jgi:hypothetical protein
MKCSFGELNSAKGPSVKCPFDEISVRRNVHSIKWYFGEISLRRKGFSEMSFGEMDFGEKSGYPCDVTAALSYL